MRCGLVSHDTVFNEMWVVSRGSMCRNTHPAFEGLWSIGCMEIKLVRYLHKRLQAPLFCLRNYLLE